MKRFLLIALACFAMVGCKKAFDKLEKDAYEPGAAPGGAQPNSGGASGGSGGAVQAVRGAVKREELEAALQQIKLFIDTASSVDGMMPSTQTTFDTLRKEAPKFAKFVSDGNIVLNPATSRDEVWAYAILPQGNYAVATASGIERMNQQQLTQRLGR